VRDRVGPAFVFGVLHHPREGAVAGCVVTMAQAGKPLSSKQQRPNSQLVNAQT